MSVSRINIYSKSLLRTVDVTVILPVENNLEKADFQYQTLYLLHGGFGSDIDWLHNTRIKLWADEYNLAVVMPSGENGFYIDNPALFNNFSTFVGQELVELTREMYPLSSNREDTFIAGLSMGGFGALLNGYKYNQTFGYIGAFSAALLAEMDETLAAGVFPEPFFEQLLGCSLRESRNTLNDPRYVIEHSEGELPQLYLACGTEDFIYSSSIAFHQYLVYNHIEHQFVTEPGSHEWYYWDKKILDFLKWLPLEKTLPPQSSGNVIVE